MPERRFYARPFMALVHHADVNRIGIAWWHCFECRADTPLKHDESLSSSPNQGHTLSSKALT
jgi:hypothetical protein